MKIPFDISKRPQIESGEYKLSFDGKPARIICWDKKMSKDNATLVALIDDGESEHTEYFFSDGLAICATAPALYIITPEPELSEFEKHLKQLLDFSVTLSSPYEIDCIKSEAAELLELARKELEPEVLERLEIAHKNQDEVVYENGKREGKAEALKEIEQDPESSYAFKRGFEYGKEEALKDLPRWRYKKGGTGPILHDCIVLNKYGCIGKSPSGALLGGVWILEYNELVKLPKED